MDKVLTLWRYNPRIAWPTDLTELAELHERIWAAGDNLIERGEIYEIGFFSGGTSGYAHCRPGVENVFYKEHSLFPRIDLDVHDIVPWERGKEIMRGIAETRGLQIPRPRENTQQPLQSLSIADEIRKFAVMRDDGLITNDEFNEQKAWLLKRS